MVASALVPFASVAFAGGVNTAAMRNSELSTGIDVYNKETGEVYGISKVAAREAVGLTIISRVAISAGTLAIPPVITGLLAKSKLQNLLSKKKGMCCG